MAYPHLAKVKLSQYRYIHLSMIKCEVGTINLESQSFKRKVHYFEIQRDSGPRLSRSRVIFRSRSRDRGHPPSSRLSITFSDMADTHYNMYAAACLRPPQDLLRSSHGQGSLKTLENRDGYMRRMIVNLAYLIHFKIGDNVNEV